MTAGTMRPLNPMAAALCVALLIVALPGCWRGGGELDGTQWTLTEWSVSSLSPGDFRITATFADGQIHGHSGVNTYGGPYRLGAGHAFSVGPLASTEMAGPEPAMRAERAYMTLLGEAQSYRLAQGRLTLFDAGGNESLIFAALSR